MLCSRFPLIFGFLFTSIRDEVIFDDVLNDVIEQDRTLIAVTNNVELLIFSSHLLPPDDRRVLENLYFSENLEYCFNSVLGISFNYLCNFSGICRKYYLWGVFKQKPIK